MNTHGGNRKAASEKYNIAHDEIIDFSSNINPLGLHPDIQSIVSTRLHTLMYYPDPECTELKQAIAEFYGIEERYILPGNGSVELIHLIARVLEKKHALITQPNFSEYEASLDDDVAIDHLTGNEEDGFHVSAARIIDAITEDSVVYLSNPNSPVGYVYSKDAITAILERCREYRTHLVIDEAFLGFLEDDKNITMIDTAKPYVNLIVIKSFTKIYAIPGVRLGVVVADEDIIKEMQKHQIPWSVNNLAQSIVMNILHDKKYIRETITCVKEEKEFLIRELGIIKDINLFPTQANYILCKMTGEMKMQKLQDELAADKIIIRDCSNYRGLGDRNFRIAVRPHAENELLVKVMKKIFTGIST
ncbi:threonine-phosphate decarboxylase CobD [Spirochaetota bacterium]